MLELSATGAVLQYRGAIGTAKQCFIAAAGPCTGLIVAFLAARVGMYTYAGVNLLLNIFNLLPIAPLDGWTILDSVLEGKGITHVISLFFAVLITLFGIGIAILGGGFALAGMGLLLLMRNTCNRVKKAIQ